MRFITSAVTDAGRKTVNQDAVMVKVADTDTCGRIAMAAVCDGVGGLAHGEVASAAIIRRFEKWFHNELPLLLTPEDSTDRLDPMNEERKDMLLLIRNQWGRIVTEMNKSIAAYGNEKNIQLGTTAVVAMIMGGRYLIMNVGDSRAYMVTDTEAVRITHDQSYIQLQIDKGLMTEEEAKDDPARGVLLQCIGSSEEVVPDYYQGEISGSISVVLCCDGFWKRNSEADILADTRPASFESEAVLDDRMIKRIGMLKDSGETDNISVVVIGAMEE